MEDFFTDEKGVDWFCTGDVAEISDDGKVKIIDRKKDLVKLQHGEYISLGRVESVIKTNALVDNVCVYANSLQRFPAALVVPNKERMENLAAEMGIDIMADLYNNKMIKKEVLRQLVKHSEEAGLGKYETISNIAIIADNWTPESGMVTATFKLKRRAIEDKYIYYNSLYLNQIT